MSLANYFTILRILLVPVLVAFLLDPDFDSSNSRIISLIILAVASFTDALDGYLARVRNEVTRLGRMLDPIADKLLISAAFISLVRMGLAPTWMVVIILGREFAVSGLRLIATAEGIEIKVSHYGKFKMFAQVIAVGLLIYSPVTFIYGHFMLYVVMGLAIISMALYFRKFWIAINPERKKQLAHRRTLREIKEDVLQTTRSLGQMRRVKKVRRKQLRLQKKVEKHQRRLESARLKQRDLSGNVHPLTNVRKKTAAQKSAGKT